MPSTTTHVQTRYNLPRRDITVFLKASKYSNRFLCIHCGKQLMSRKKEAWEVFEGMRSDGGFTYGYEPVSFPTTIRCGSKKCGIYWHFHMV